MVETKSQKINLAPFIIGALSSEPAVYDEVDKIYENYIKSGLIEDVRECIDKSNNKNNIISTRGGLLYEYYYQKILGIIEFADMTTNEKECEERWKDVHKLIKKGYRYTYDYLKTKKKIVFEDYIAAFVKKHNGVDNITNTEFTNNCVIFLCLASNLKEEKIEKTSMLQNFLIQEIARLEDSFSINNSATTIISRLSKDKRKIISNLKLKLKNDNDMSLKITDRFKIPNEKTENFIDGILRINEILNVNMETALSVNDIGEKDIDQIILSYIDSLEDDEIDFDTVKEYYTLTLPYYIALKFINEEKKSAKRIITLNTKEYLLEKNLVSNKQSLEIKEKNNELNSLRKKVIELEKKNKRLSNELKETKSNKNELVSLRNFVFNNLTNENIEETTAKTIDYDKLNSYKVAVIGGLEIWRNKLKEKFEDWIYIDPSFEKVDINLLKKADYIVININVMGHGLYYKIVSNCNRQKIIYINNSNIDISIGEIYKNIVK